MVGRLIVQLALIVLLSTFVESTCLRMLAMDKLAALHLGDLELTQIVGLLQVVFPKDLMKHWLVVHLVEQVLGLLNLVLLDGRIFKLLGALNEIGELHHDLVQVDGHPPIFSPHHL